MTTASGPPFELGTQEANFLQTSFLSIVAASRGPNNIPCLARALACRLSSDRRQVTLLFCSCDANQMLDHIAANGAIAAVFSVPSTHESLQLKGVDAKVQKPAAADSAFAGRQLEAFIAHVGKLGHPPDLVQRLMSCEPGDLVAVTFTPSAAFSQTPGPRAGHAIGVPR
jgi:hypothetical protein